MPDETDKVENDRPPAGDIVDTVRSSSGERRAPLKDGRVGVASVEGVLLDDRAGVSERQPLP